MRKSWMIAGLIVTGWLTSALPSAAHSPLKSTSPDDGAVLTAAPSSIAMTFGKSARLTKVTLKHTSGRNAHSVRVPLALKKFQKSFELMPQMRGAGDYQVDWRALSKDGHAIKGSFSFTIEE